ncbi:MarR family transcriptional regulator [Nocardia zapadnayensis]|uniref:MarR family winged helix-turn-helix transcriptional regulator n=1 Tax=Brevibacterium sp. R8603A2 TaxID=2929779 RepID=UPI001FF88F23|nr:MULTISPECIES: MarR family transcriptional regulator [Actinomycetes]MCK1801444.1 MarR family transcriptional regulator [Brevibacterium sp. R8603A2]MCX0277718.1 MarR family transcriptional regulator [Nocardia zapadnayensis]
MRAEFDPIEESRKQWLAHGWSDSADGMTLVTSIMRAHQLLLARVDRTLKPFALTFSRYEVLALLSFTRRGSLPMNKITKRLQVHATSTTNSVDRLEAAGLAARRPHPADGRTTLVEITEAGRTLAARATAALNAEVFDSPGLEAAPLQRLLGDLAALRAGLEPEA